MASGLFFTWCALSAVRFARWTCFADLFSHIFVFMFRSCHEVIAILALAGCGRTAVTSWRSITDDREWLKWCFWGCLCGIMLVLIFNLLYG